MPIYRGPGGAGDATGDATNASVLAVAAAAEAQASATSAASSATNAASSASAAASSETDAGNSATAAATSATDAAASASTASTQATNASNSATSAASSATAASSSASSASSSASAASTSATNAASSASSASTSATNASNSASAAATSATNAANSASDAADSAALAATFDPALYLTKANPSFTGTLTGTGDIRLNNGTADGAQLQLASSGYSDWNLDNYSGRLRAYYGSTEYFSLSNTGTLTVPTLTVTNTVTTANNLGLNPYGNGFKNRIINGAMMIDQRNAGASVNLADGVYNLDRYQGSVSQSSKVTIQRSSTAPAGFVNSQVLTVSSAMTFGAGDYCGNAQSIEGYNVSDLGFGTASAQTVTVSFWVRSSITGTYSVALHNAAFNRTNCKGYTINSANTWEYKTITFTGDTSGTWLTDNSIGIKVYFTLGMGSTYGGGTDGVWSSTPKLAVTGQTNWASNAGATFYITGVQLEKGSTATSFDYRPYGTELALCQRYYQVMPSKVRMYGYNTASGETIVPVCFPVYMRSTPTVSANFESASGAVGSIENISTQGFSIQCSATVGGVFRITYSSNNTASSEL